MRAYNFGARGSNLTKLLHVMCRDAGMITCVQLLGGPAPLKFGKAKTSKVRRDFGQRQTLIENVSGAEGDAQ